MADMVRKQISDEIKEAGHFAIMVDESKDISKKEQISVVVRYLHNHFTAMIAVKWLCRYSSDCVVIKKT